MTIISLPPGTTDLRQIVFGANQSLERWNGSTVNSFTLTSSSTATTVKDLSVGPNSVIIWMPTTPDAASQMATLFTVSRSAGSFTLNHGKNANNDQIFDYVAIG